MRKEKFVYNEQTLRYEKVRLGWQERGLRILGFLCAGLLTAFLFTLVIWNAFPSPKERALQREIDEVRHLIAQMNTSLDQSERVLDNIHERDNYVHRLTFGMDPVEDYLWEGGVGGSQRYAELLSYQNTGELLQSTRMRMDKFRRQLRTQSTSMDTLESMANNKAEMLASIPMISPVRSDKLARRVQSLSGFGMRLHPILKRMKMHTGIDFTARKGTPIQATGDGRIKKVVKKNSGYGYYVVIDHGFGYESLYAHMQRIDVKVGEKVVRGQKIGTVGSTGRSTAPHCHYEVLYQGKKIDPINYVLDGLSPEEYEQLTEQAASINQSMDY